MEQGNVLGGLLLLGTFFSLLLILVFPEKKDHIVSPSTPLGVQFSQQKFLVFSGLISVFFAFSFISIDNAHNDYYRYIWDGKASEIAEQTGKNVYEVTPRETYDFIDNRDVETRCTVSLPNCQPVSLLDEFFQKTGFHDYYTTYPPVLQLVFFASSEISGYNYFWYSEPPKFPEGQERGLKFIFFLFFLGILFLVYQIFWNNLENSGMQKYRKFVPTVFLSPLLLWEGIAAGHSEIVFVFFLLLSIFFMQRQKYFWAGMSLAGLVWVKFFPAVLGLIFLWEIWRREYVKVGATQWVAPTGKIQNILLFIVGGIISTVLLWLPFLPFDPENFLEALQLYAAEWRMFPLFYDILENSLSTPFAQLTQIFLVLSVMIFGIFRKFSLEKNIFWTLLIYLLFSPAVFSWYFLWIFPLGIFVLGSEKKYFLLLSLAFTPFVQYFYSVFDPEKNIFFYQDNGLEISQKIIFWGLLMVALLTMFSFSLWKKYKKLI